MKIKQKCLAAFFVLLVLCVLGFLALSTQIGGLEKLMYPQKYTEAVTKYADEYNIDPLLVYTIIRTESGFNADATSQVQARGLMQITQETFEWIKSMIAPAEEMDFDAMYVPEQNIRFGSYFLSVCLRRYEGDVKTAAAAYHSGMGKVDSLLADGQYSTQQNILSTFPYPQMNNYVYKVSRNYGIYQRLYESKE